MTIAGGRARLHLFFWLQGGFAVINVLFWGFYEGFSLKMTNDEG
jgi:hypothetical protein